MPKTCAHRVRHACECACTHHLLPGYTLVQARVHTCMHMYLLACASRSRTHLHMHIRAHTCRCTHSHTHICIHQHMLPGHTCTHLYTHADLCMYMHMYAVLLVVIGKEGWSLGGIFPLSHDTFISCLCPYQLAGKDRFAQSWALLAPPFIFYGPVLIFLVVLI